MKKIFFAFCLLFSYFTSIAQSGNFALYQKKSVMIPMRDGVKLFTVVLSPAGNTSPLPVLLTRTPYGADVPVAEDSTINLAGVPSYSAMAKEGYIFVFQDIRGKYKSEGTMEIHQPLIHATQKNAIDESTDTWDAVDWLVKNIRYILSRMAGIGGSSRSAPCFKSRFGTSLYGRSFSR
jgi:uncharacterized protein